MSQSKLKGYEISLTIYLDEDSPHPRKWIPDAIYDNLDIKLGEFIQAYKYKEIEQ